MLHPKTKRHTFKLRRIRLYFWIVILFAANSCYFRGNPSAKQVDPGFGAYWYQGKAELSSYNLEQALYGEMRSGEAVMIFVTEDMSQRKKVKPDDPQKDPKDVVKVLKLNATKNFTTGIYPYSTMTSVFTPVDMREYPKTFKLTTSSQEWCGQTFLQANLRGNNYHVQGLSYFEQEGDKAYNEPAMVLEDEIWNRIRLNPESLPTGEFVMFPGSLFCRFKHVPFKAVKATATLTDPKSTTRRYQVSFPSLQRNLSITFRTVFPYQILSWEESYPDGGKIMTTKATLKESLLLDYWTKNHLADSVWRERLRLE